MRMREEENTVIKFSLAREEKKSRRKIRGKKRGKNEDKIKKKRMAKEDTQNNNVFIGKGRKRKH